MNDDELEPQLRDMAQDYRRPPAPDREAMWARIQAERAAGQVKPGGMAPTKVLAFPLPRWTLPVGMAALLALAFGLGRLSREPVVETAAAPANPPVATPEGNRMVHQVAAEEYFGRVEVFLTDLPRVAKEEEGKEEVAGQARRLLATTRLLLDTPAGDDARLRPLLEDLELVLAGIAQLPVDRAGELDLIAEGLDRRGTLSLLRSKVSAGPVPAFNQGEL